MSSEMRATVERDILLKHQNNPKRKNCVNAMCVAAAETAVHEESIQTRSHMATNVNNNNSGRICFFFYFVLTAHCDIYYSIYCLYANRMCLPMDHMVLHADKYIFG